MKLFVLDHKEARIVSINPRIEKHGQEGNRLAYDVRLGFTMPNDFLNLFGAGMKETFYRRPDAPDLADTDDHMPILRHPMLGRQSIDFDWVNCLVTVHRGLTGEQDIVMADAKINKVSFVALDGGSVEFEIRVQFNPDPEEPDALGALNFEMESKTVTISTSRPLDDAPDMVSNEPEHNPVEKNARKQKPHERNPEMFADPDSALH